LKCTASAGRVRGATNPRAPQNVLYAAVSLHEILIAANASVGLLAVVCSKKTVPQVQTTLRQQQQHRRQPRQQQHNKQQPQQQQHQQQQPTRSGKKTHHKATPK
jgi:hypothetical protein